MYQVVVAGEIIDANVDAEEDLSFRIPPADFTEILEEAGVPADAAAALQATLFDAGYGRAMPWVNPVRAELSALGNRIRFPGRHHHGGEEVPPRFGGGGIPPSFGGRGLHDCGDGEGAARGERCSSLQPGV